MLVIIWTCGSDWDLKATYYFLPLFEMFSNILPCNLLLSQHKTKQKEGAISLKNENYLIKFMHIDTETTSQCCKMLITVFLFKSTVMLIIVHFI